MSLSWVNTLVCPPGKLDSNFPWTLREASKRYFKSLGAFAIGSFAVPVLFLGGVLALCQYPAVIRAFMDRQTTGIVVAYACLAGTLLAAVTQLIRWRLRRLTINFTRVARLLSYSAIFGLLFGIGFVYALGALFPVFPALIKRIADMLSDSAGNPNMSFVMILSTVSFVLGFGMQMRSISRSLQQSGTTLRQFMALNIDKRRGSRWWITALKVVWPVVVCFILWQPIEWGVIQLLGPCEQPTMKLAREATGGNFLLFAIMAAIGAPIFEEMVFRGFLMQVVRSSLKSELPAPEMVVVPTEGRRLKLRRAWANADNWVRRTSFACTSFFHRILGGSRADLTAVLLSSFMFAVLHMQFQPTALALLFLLGLVHAELYRRTGSLYCSMLLHFANNGTVVVMLALGH